MAQSMLYVHDQGRDVPCAYIHTKEIRFNGIECFFQNDFFFLFAKRESENV